ncbi:MAG: C40 family peptidase [Gordonia amarae]
MSGTISTEDGAVQTGSDNAASRHAESRPGAGAGTGDIDPRFAAGTDDANRRADRLRTKAGEGIDKTKADSKGKSDIDSAGSSDVGKSGTSFLSALGKAGESLLGSLGSGGGQGGGGSQMPSMPTMPSGLMSGMSPDSLKSLLGDGNGMGGLSLAGQGSKAGMNGPGGVGDNDFQKTLLARANEAVAAGIPYAWGGGSLEGPTGGIHDGGAADAAGDYNKSGFDCSGLARYLIYQSSGVEIPRTSEAQFSSGVEVSASDARIGDLVFPNYAFHGGGGPSHVQVYVGDGLVVEAQQSGTNMMYSKVPAGRFVRVVNS